ncbi:hypothetical protein B0T10DRAFT_457640 [Thelonectria olida]|uniref:Uncharacterized protein n=1 Tax=Thelonectria olida TaxID=1576542 RepID=A0A9P8WC03_9HYPO|nr:hypothetical protein B0T10DRAFT_457640 [Thelonectria olida]
MPQFKFVAVEGGDRKPSTLTRSIRSHAIRAGLQKNTSSSRRAKAAVQSLCSTKFRGELMFHLEPREGLERLNDMSTPSVPNMFAEVLRLPLIGIETTANLPVLTKFDLNLATVDRAKSWFPYAMRSAPMMHSTLAMTAALWRTEYPALQHSIQLEGIRQKGEAMREISARLAHAGSVRSDDETDLLLSTMSTLVTVEVCDGDFEAAATHLRGVHNLLSSRGSLDRLKDKFIVCKSINLADIQVAAALGHRLVFPLLHADNVHIPASISEHARQSPFDHLITDDGPYHHGRIFAQLRRLLLARQSSMVPLEALRALFNVVDDSILRHLYQDCIGLSDASRRSRTLVLAAHVFMYVTLRQVPPKSPLVRRMCTRLQNTVGSSPTAREIWTDNGTALLWIAFVGLLGTGEGAETCLEGQWFLKLFQSTVQGYPQDFARGNGGVRGILSTFLWDELYCAPLLAGLKECIP